MKNTDPNNLQKFEKKKYSQNGEDGIISEIFRRIGTETRFAVEFGVEDGKECNTRLLKKNGWKVVQMDGGDNNPKSVKKEFINAENINRLFSKYEVPLNLDLLSIDIDSNDFWVWRAIESKYKPRLIIIEYNATISPASSLSIKYNRFMTWDGTSEYFGASLKALHMLGKIKGYELVYCDSKGVNAFFVRKDLISKNIKPISVNQAYRPYSNGVPLKSSMNFVKINLRDCNDPKINFLNKIHSYLGEYIEYKSYKLKHFNGRLNIKGRIKRFLRLNRWYIKGKKKLSFKRLVSFIFYKTKRYIGFDKSFSNMTKSTELLDIFIPAIDKDFQILPLCIDYARKNIQHKIGNIYVISPDSDVIKKIAKTKKCMHVSENNIIPIKKDSIGYFCNGFNRNGWIFQQLLKLNSDKICKNKNILILDADTLFISPIRFFSGNTTYFNFSDEYNEDYYEMNIRLLMLKHIHSRSRITHYMLFRSEVLEKLRNDIEKHNRKPWYEAIIAKLDRKVGASFSEYELYADYYDQVLNLPLSNNYWSNLSIEFTEDVDLRSLINISKKNFKSISIHNYKKDLT